MPVWNAQYLDGHSATRQPAAVTITRTGLEVVVAGRRRFWPLSEVRQTQGFYAGEQVRLERGGELSEVLIVADLAFLSALHAAAPEAAGAFHNPARRRFRVPLTLMLGLATVALAAALYLWGIPGFAGFAADRVPVSWEAALGDVVLGHLAPPDKRCVDPERQRIIDELTATLAQGTPGQPYTFRVTVVNHPLVNAFAAPGGVIVVFRGLLDRTDSAEELAGVLAHEVQHVLHRHATRALFRQASTGILMAALVGDVSGLVAFGVEGARMLGDMRHSRHSEEEADRDGLRLLQAAGIDPAGMLAFYESMKKLEGGNLPGFVRYLSTHPAAADRLQRLTALAAQPPPRPSAPLLPDYDWSDIKKMCGPPLASPPRPGPTRR